MPCDRIRTTSVQLDQCNETLMMTALRALGHTPALDANLHRIYFGNGEWIDCKTGQARLSAYTPEAQLKKAYSTAIVQATVKKFGWTPASTNTETHFVVNRR